MVASDYGPLSEVELKLLMGYAEEDLYNADRQSFAFPILHSLLKKGVQSYEMESIGKKVLKLSITGETEGARNGAKAFFVSYLMSYPLGNSFNRI